MVQVIATKESINPVKHSDKVLVVKRERAVDEELRAKIVIGVLSGLLGATLGAAATYFLKKGVIRVPTFLTRKVVKPVVVEKPVQSTVVVEKPVAPVVVEKRL